MQVNEISRPHLLDHIDRSTNTIIKSSIALMDHQIPESGLSIKWATKGIEYYQVGGQNYTLQPDQFMVVHPGKSLHFHNPTKEAVEGICIYLDPKLSAEIWSAKYYSLDRQLGNPFSIEALPNFLDLQINNLSENKLGHWLGSLKHIDWQRLDEHFYIQTTEHLISSELNQYAKVNQIHAAKQHTKQELYRRLSIARQYIFENYREDIDLDAIAKAALLSKYHLIRTFQQLYGVAPVKLLNQYRLQQAKRMIKAQKDPDLWAIAESCGFRSKRALQRLLKIENTQ